MTTRTNIALLVTMMTNAVVFGVGAVIILSIPQLSANAAILLPLVIVASLIIGPIFGWIIAPRLRARWQRDHAYID